MNAEFTARLIAALRAVNQTLINPADETALCNACCSALVTTGALIAARLYFVNSANQSLTCAASAGVAPDPAELALTADAFALGTPQTRRLIATSCAAFPLALDTGPPAVLLVSAAEHDFDPTAMTLLTGAAALIGGTLEQLRTASKPVTSDPFPELIFAHAQDIIYRFRLAPEPGFEYVSPSATTITGYTPADHYADPGLGRKLIHPDDLVVLDQLSEQPDGQPIVLRWVRKDGSVIWTEQRNTLIFNDGGAPVAIVGIARDITRQKQAAAREQMQFAVTHLLAAAAPVDYTITQLLQTIARYQQWDIGEFWVFDHDSGCLRRTGSGQTADPALAAFAEQSNRLRFWPGEGLPGRTWQSGEPIWIPDVTCDTAFLRSDLAAHAGLHGALACPVHHGADMQGVLVFFSRRVLQPDEEIIQILANISRQFGQFLAYRRSSVALDASQSRLQLTFAQLPAIVWTTDSDLRITSEYGSALPSFSAQSFVGMTIAEVFGPTQAGETVITAHERALRGESVQYETRFGGRVADARVEPRRDEDGMIVGCLGVALDITERRAAEAAAFDRLRELSTVAATARKLQQLHTPAQLVEEVIAVLESAISFTYSTVLLLEADGRLQPFAVGERRHGRTFAERDKALITAYGLRLGVGMVGWIAQTGQSLRSGDVRNDSRYIPVHPTTRSALGVPLRAGDSVLGVVFIETDTVDAYNDADQRLLETVAAQIAIAIQNAHLYEQVLSGRTELQLISRRLLEVQEQERRQIARELHDEIGQLLTGLNLVLNPGTAQQLDTTSTLREARTLVHELISRVRTLSLDLRPPMLDDLGLLPTLNWHVQRVEAQSQLTIRISHSGLNRRLHPDVEIAAYRIVQEALTNVARHAAATTVNIRLWVNDATLGVQVEDDGCGFDPATALAAGRSSGLSGMHERALLLGGMLEIESVPGTGACITAELPLAPFNESA